MQVAFGLHWVTTVLLLRVMSLCPDALLQSCCSLAVCAGAELCCRGKPVPTSAQLDFACNKLVVQVKPPRIQQSAVHFECKLVHTYPVKNKCVPEPLGPMASCIASLAECTAPECGRSS